MPGPASARGKQHEQDRKDEHERERERGPRERGPRPVTRESDRTYLEKLLLAATVILEAAPDLDLVADSVEGELDILKDRLEHALLLPEGETR
jgi:hypothetical protein